MPGISYAADAHESGIMHLPQFYADKGAFAPDPTLQHSPNHIACPACSAANDSLHCGTADMASMLFTDAAALWMERRAQSTALRLRTHETTRGYLIALDRFFAGLGMREITAGHLRAYQVARLHNLVQCEDGETTPWKRHAGHSTINHELGTLCRMLAHCRLWHPIKPYYFPLPMRSWSPRQILTEADEERFWKAAARHPEAHLAYCVAAITNNTTAAGIELRGLRLKHIFLHANIPEIYIPEDSVKNNSRPRKIALNPTAKWAVQQCYSRALRLGACEPDHHLFPFRIKRNLYDPSLPPSRWFLRDSWTKLRRATGTPGLNPHDLRHHCITRLLENDVNPETVQAIAGHVGRRMMEYYAHQRTRVKYEAVLAIEPGKKPSGSVRIGEREMLANC